MTTADLKKLKARAVRASRSLTVFGDLLLSIEFQSLSDADLETVRAYFGAVPSIALDLEIEGRKAKASKASA